MFCFGSWRRGQVFSKDELKRALRLTQNKVGYGSSVFTSASSIPGKKKKSPIEHLPSARHLLVTDSCFVYMAWLWFGGLEERGWELLGGLILQYLFPGTKWSAGLADCFMMLLLLRAVVPGRCSKESLWLAFVGTKSLVSPGHWASFTSSWTGLPTKLKVWEKESTHEGDFERNSSLLIIERFGLESPYRSSRPALMPWWWVIAKAG